MSDTEPVATSTIAVHRGAWSQLPPEMAAMVAPPVSVSAAPLSSPDQAVGPWRKGQLARSRGNMPVRRHQPAAR